MSNRIVYNRLWTESTISQIKHELELLINLKNQLYNAKNNLPPEVTADITRIIHEAERLEFSLRVSQDAFQSFLESAQRNFTEAVRDYEEAELLATHLFD